MNRITNIVKQAGVLLLGGIFVSAFWDFLIKDTFLKIGKWIFDFSSRFSNKVGDYLFTSISTGDTLFVIFPTYILMAGLIIIALGSVFKILLRLRYSEIKEIEPDKINTESKNSFSVKKLRMFSILLFIIATLGFISIFSIYVLKYSLKLSFEKNLLIIKPFINENEYDLYYSEYIRINSKKEAVTLFEKIEKVGNKHDIKIKDVYF